MATFTVNRDVNAAVGPFQVAAIAGSTQSCPDDLFAELEAALEASPGVVVTLIGYDRDARLVNVKSYGATGDGVTDDTAAIQAALTAAAGDSLYIPAGTYLVSSVLSYDVAALGPIKVRGDGPNTILKATGASNKVLRFTGTPGVTGNYTVIESLTIFSATTGTSAAAIDLDGLALVGLRDVCIDGNNKMTVGVLCTGTQQGEISGGWMGRMATGIKLVPSAGAVHSNGLDIHGVSLFATGTNLYVDSVDSLFFTNNHATTASIGVDMVSSGNGPVVIASNHFESHVTAGLRLAGSARVLANNFFPTAGGTDLLVSAGGPYLVQGNLFNGNVTLAAGATNVAMWSNSFAGGAFTDSATGTNKFGNTNTGGGPVVSGSVLSDDLALTARRVTAGDILKLTANAGYSGSWGMSIVGAGPAQDVYLKLHDVVLAGSTAGGVVKVMSGVGGTRWAQFSTGLLEIDGVSGALILKSPDGTRYALRVANGGTLSITAA